MSLPISIRCQHLAKSFKTGEAETVALRDIDLTVHRGEFMMMVGPSGCGKTTLISIIAGILKPDQGTCIVNDCDYNTFTSEDLLNFRAKNIGFIFQSFNLIPTLTVLENISIPLVINGMSRPEALDQASYMINEVGLADKKNSLPNQLSGGQQQRVAIARSLIHNPSLLICDEPTSALDHSTGMKILELMKSINKRLQTTFLIVTHDNRIFEYADRIAHMDDGIITHISEN
jgi:putative ABC transport system ATP-binding protein